MKIVPRTIPGSLVVQNKGSLCWSPHGLIAYGAHNVVAVVNSISLEIVTTLHAHRSPITRVSIASPSVSTDDHSPHVYLASADTSGFMVLFDVTKARASQRLSEANKVINDMELFYSNAGELVLLSLHQPAILCLWNPLTGEQLWKLSFGETLQTFCRDPFDSNKLVLQGSRYVQIVENFSTSQQPSEGTRYQLTQARSTDSLSPTYKEIRKTTSIEKASLMLEDFPSTRQGSPEEELPLNHMQKVFFHKTWRHTLILQYNQDLLLLDLDIKQTIGLLSLDRSTCPFVQVYPCRLRDALYCLHDNGAVVFRSRRSDGASSLRSMSYEPHSTSDSLRITKQQRIFDLAVCPSSELRSVVLTSEGKLLLWELQTTKNGVLQNGVTSLCDVLYSSTCSTMLSPKQRCYFLLSGMTSSLSVGPFVVKMCPPLTTKNFHLYQPLLAIGGQRMNQGSVNGMIHIYNTSTGQCEKDIAVHSCQVRGIEWASLYSIVSHAAESNASGVTGNKSELAFTNIKTGQATQFRKSKSDEGVIQMIRISQLKQYMVIVFKSKPMELWDLRSLTLLREMQSDFPVITSLEWSPAPFRKKLREEVDEGGRGTTWHPEHFVFTDNTCLLYHYIVEGSVVKDGSKIAAEGVSGTVTALAWKQELLILGDMNGTLSFWDLKIKRSNNVSVRKGMIRKIRFAPGKDNNKVLVLFNEEVHIWDKNRREIVSVLKFPKEIGRVSDVDWVASDKVVLSVADGYVTITDQSLHTFMSPFSDLSPPEGTILPCLLGKKARYAVKYTTAEDRWTSQLLPDNVSVIPSELQDKIKESSPIDRCITLSIIYGDQFAMDFWMLTKYILRHHKDIPASGTHTDEMSRYQKNEEVESYATVVNPELEDIDSMDTLESGYDIFLPGVMYKDLELSRLALQEKKASVNEMRRKCANKYMLLGQSDKAVNLLLEAEPVSAEYYTDSLRACLLSTIRSSGSSQSTMKLVATGLIAHGKLNEGVELLCLIDKGLDACRYLQTYGHWTLATWLAKVNLNEEDRIDIMTRWINDYLFSPPVNEKPRAVFAALSIADYMKTAELLYSMQCFSLSALFVKACLESGTIILDDNNSAIIQAINLQYARVLRHVGVREGAVYYAAKAGESGLKLLSDVKQEIEKSEKEAALI